MKRQEHASNIAQYYQWDGEEVIQLMIDALTECNYHTEVKAIRSALALTGV